MVYETCAILDDYFHVYDMGFSIIFIQGLGPVIKDKF